MSRDIVLNKIELSVLPNEFEMYIHKEYNNLKLYRNLGEYERMCGLIVDVCKELNITEIFCCALTHGDFILKFLEQTTKLNIIKINNNEIKKYNTSEKSTKLFIFDLKSNEIMPKIETTSNVIMIMRFGSIAQLKDQFSIDINGVGVCPASKRRISCLIKSKIFSKEWMMHNSWLKSNTVCYDNLIDMCIMVKNAGPQFVDMLNHNKSLGDKWTIMDTGSTDGTCDVIKDFLQDKPHSQYIAIPFKDFKYNRNKCLDVAGTRCKYTLMLDDTYRISDCDKLREFLDTVRDDVYASSYSLYIVSDDVKYTTNRIVKTENKLRYVFKIHEVISEKENNNVIIPSSVAEINDGRYDYMEERTMKRKQFDMKLLFDELDEDINNPRTYYYIAQTYNLLEDYENAYKYFKLRGDFVNSGFIQERIDALFEAARIANFKLNKSWDECLELYNRAYDLDKSRPEVPYFIGIHYYTQNDYKNAFPYFKLAYDKGFPEHCQYGLKPTLSFYFLPKILANICYEIGDYKLGYECCLKFLSLINPIKPSSSSALVTNEDYELINSWKNIYENLILFNNAVEYNDVYLEDDKPIFLFMADGGFSNWTGSDIEHKGVGGSETFIIEFAKYIQQSGQCNVIVCCKCDYVSQYKNVWYIPLSAYHSLCKYKYIKYCMISRFSEYIPVALKSKCENVFFIIHDLGPSGLVIPIEPKLKQVFCLTPWHCDFFTQRFPQLKNITSSLGYGINKDVFDSITRNPHENINFIYSSYPNRGLLQLLEIWPDIIKLQPNAELHIYSDIYGKWANDVAPQDMQKIKNIIGAEGVRYHGWVDKKTLAQGWKDADVWLYPCTFKETFCLTAYECALSKTLAITNGLAALNDTVGSRGICVEGDVTTEEWKKRVMDLLSVVLQNLPVYQSIIERNYDYVVDKSWESQANHFYDNYCKPLWRETRDKSPMYLGLSNVELNKSMFNSDKRNVYIIGDCTGSTASILMEAYGQYIKFIQILNKNEKDIDAFNNNTKPCQKYIIYKSSNDIYNLVLSYINAIDVLYIDSNILNKYELYSILMLSIVVLQKNGFIVVYNPNEAVHTFIDLNKCNFTMNDNVMLIT
jgi:hypothetical protein